MFTGSTSLNLDAKGRLTMPTRYRASLNEACGGQLVLTRHPYDECLALYPRDEFMETAGKLSAQRDSSPQVRQLKRRFLGQAVEIDMDSNGRLLVPPELRAAIGLEKQAMLIGQMHRFEIWKAESWLEEDGTLDPDALPESVQELSF
ncbi:MULTISPECIES: division/cell wall cluster transcriptional repressor MraZ [Alcanivorax]|nr:MULTISPECIES: division/cell wall cluster transcriptional repressor MraZ [Alcanivorax]KZX74765.1 division/cell wall cluster transcriptional repressor MraZ [Alcanivorax sp. HI0011]KZX83565.1 division/cell wall cluster transcriptional repressor MraZ [Alcanivorax sp. HI0013]KZY14675.1 division/cell wall cluster transcriptional repressor MraZ [Alcanivorax sp. HI0035]KZX68212.1 division/cell wall cluster transcriptional repressor MraZ [Alcanivorax sp. HI0003]KZX68864.1 division/cell wall cluster 